MEMENGVSRANFYKREAQQSVEIMRRSGDLAINHSLLALDGILQLSRNRELHVRPYNFFTSLPAVRGGS